MENKAGVKREKSGTKILLKVEVLTDNDGRSVTAECVVTKSSTDKTTLEPEKLCVNSPREANDGRLTVR